MPSKGISAKPDTLDIPGEKPLDPIRVSKANTPSKKAFLPEAISSDKIDTLRKRISDFDKAIQAAKDTSAKYWEFSFHWNSRKYLT
jgi:hypothetical protein